MDTNWRLELFGRMRLYRDGLSVSEFGSRKAAELLALVALSERRSLSREELSARLWPDQEPARRATTPSEVSAAGQRSGSPGSAVVDSEVRRKRLRTELNRLRRTLEQAGAGAFLQADRETISLVTGLLVIDVTEFQDLRKRAARVDSPEERVALLDAAVRFCTGALDRSLDAEVFDRERDHLADGFLKALLDLAQAQEELGEVAVARATLQRAVSVAPYSEEAHFRLIRHRIAAGEEDAARQQYDLLLRSLQGSDPSEDLRALVAPLYGGRVASTPPTTWQDTARQLSASQTASLSVSIRKEPTTSHSTPRLPYYSTAFFGRDIEIAWLMRRLVPKDGPADTSAAEPTADGSVRLVTLTGPGGSGKTRLAVEVARRVAPAFRNAVWFLPLTDLRAPELIAAALLGALNMLPQQEDLLEQATLVLERRPSLLLLDNLEHLLPEASETVARLLTLAPTLRLLVTSRHALRLSTGVEHPLAPLPLPQEESRRATRDTSASSSRGQARSHNSNLLDNAAVALFVDRARAVRSGFATHARSHAAIASICRELEGIPLALEIAAARAASFTPSQILHHVRHQPLTLQSRNRDLDPKHRTLVGVIAGSYRRLTREQQRLFRQLAVFRGFSAEAARVVCEIEAAPALLQEFIDRSLVTVAAHGDSARYRLLEIPRAFAAAQWSEAEQSQLTDRHADYYLYLAEAAAPRLRGPEARALRERLEFEIDNFRAALDTLAERRPEDGLRMATALFPFWSLGGRYQEGRARFTQLLDANPDPTLSRARALLAVGRLATEQGDYPAAHAHLLESLEIGSRSDDLRVQAETHLALGNVLHFEADYDAAHATHARSLELWRRLPERDACGEGRTLHGLALAIRQHGDIEEALRLHQESLTLLREAGDPCGLAWALRGLGIASGLEGEWARERHCYAESLALFEEVGDRRGIAGLLRKLGDTHCPHDTRHALRYFHRSLGMLSELGEWHMVAELLERIVETLIAERYWDTTRMVRLAVASAAMRRRIGAVQPPSFGPMASETARHWSRLDAAAFECAYQEGEAMPYEAAIACALEEFEGRFASDALTPDEKYLIACVNLCGGRQRMALQSYLDGNDALARTHAGKVLTIMRRTRGISTLSEVSTGMKAGGVRARASACYVLAGCEAGHSPASARVYFRRSLCQLVGLDKYSSCSCAAVIEQDISLTAVLTQMALLQADPVERARLLGAAQALRETAAVPKVGKDWFPPLRDPSEAIREAQRQNAPAWEEGRAMTRNQALRYTLRLS